MHLGNVWRVYIWEMNLLLIPLIAGRNVVPIKDAILEHLYQIGHNVHSSKHVPNWIQLHVLIVGQVQMNVYNVTFMAYAL